MLTPQGVTLALILLTLYAALIGTLCVVGLYDFAFIVALAPIVAILGDMEAHCNPY